MFYRYYSMSVSQLIYLMSCMIALYCIAGNFQRVFIFGYFEEHHIYENKLIEIKCVPS